MTPNFALGLTELGITLWQHAGTGWLRMGAVPMDSPDFENRMQALVAKAREQAPEGIATKLVIPEGQILYTQLPVQGDDSAVRAALDGKTPYPVEELEFDYVSQGSGVLAAVVARETLTEAEDFAFAYDLNPVCFVAAPADPGFAQEPFFKTARGVRLDPTAMGRGGPILRETGVFQPPEPAAPEPIPNASAAPDAAPAKIGTPKTDAEKAGKDAGSPAAMDAKALKPAEPSTARVEQSITPAAKSQPAPKTGAAASIPAGPIPADAAKADAPKDDAPSFRSRRAAPAAPAAAQTPRAAAPATRRAAPAKARGFSLGGLGGASLTAKLRNSLGAPVSRAGNGLRSATDLLGRKLGANPTPATSAKAQPTAPRPVVSAPSAKPGQAAPVAKPDAAVSAPKAALPVATDKASGLAARTAGTVPGKTNREAERLTVFGARRGDIGTGSALPKRALLISGAALMLVLAVAIWAFYFSRSNLDDLVQPVLPEDTTIGVAAPDPLALPDPDQGITDGRAEIGSALGETAETQDNVSLSEDTLPEPVGAAPTAPVVTSPQADAGRLATLRSLRAIAPDARGALPNVQGPPAPFGSVPLPPLREELATAPDAPAPGTGPVPIDAPTAPVLPAGEEALEIVVTPGRPAVVPPARPEGLAPEPALQPVPGPDAALPADQPPAALIPGAATDAQDAAGTAAQAQPDPLGESNLVIDVTEGAPAVAPPARPEEIAPEPAAETPPAPEADGAETTTDTPIDPDQASLTPPPGGVALTLIAPTPRPTEIVDDATARAEQFASATSQAVAASVRPSNRPSEFSQTVQRALTAARISQAAPPAAEPQIVQASAASVAPRIPSSASVASAATQTRAINLRQVNLLGVMGAPNARRALVRLDNGRIVTVRVGERLDGGQVTAIGDSELRYTRRGRDIVLRIAS